MGWSNNRISIAKKYCHAVTLLREIGASAALHSGFIEPSGKNWIKSEGPVRFMSDADAAIDC